MNKNNDLYVRILLWAHEKQEIGFSWEQLKTEFSINSQQDSWVQKIFLTTSDNDRKFFEHLRNDETVTPNVHYYSLNEKGLTAAVNYLSLKETEKISKFAFWVSAFAFIISAWQFLLPINFSVGHCYVGTTVGDKITRMNCPNWIRVGRMFNLNWDSSYEVK